MNIHQTIHTKVFAICMLFLLVVASAPAPAYAVLYAPGETQSPACLPTDTDCGVTPPVTGLQAVSTFHTSLAILATSTPTSTVARLYNVGNTLYWNGTAIGPAVVSADWIVFNTTGVHLATTTNQVVIGGTATTTMDALQVQGGLYVSATTTTGALSASSAVLANVTAIGTFTTGNIVATTSATSTFAGGIEANSLKLGSGSGILLATFGAVQNVATSSLGIAVADTTGVLAVARGGTGTSTVPTFGKILIGNASGGYDLVATSTLGMRTTDVAEGTNLYYTDARSRASLSSTATGLSYATSTGTLSLTSGYMIPLTASTTEWANKVSSQWVTSGSDISYSTGNVGIGTTTPGSKLVISGDFFATGSLTGGSTFMLAEQPGSSLITASAGYGKMYTKAATGDGVDSYTKLLVHADGANGSTAFADTSLSGKTLTSQGGASVGTVVTKFGTGALALDGTSQYVAASTSVDFDMPNNTAFTLDFWFNASSTTGTRPLVVNGENANNYWAAQLSDGQMQFVLQTGGGAAELTMTDPSVVSAGAWHHYALVRTGTGGATENYVLYKDGVSVATGTASINPSLTVSTLNIGSNVAAAGTAYFGGYIDEVRISNGNARYAANFTPSTGPYGSGLFYLLGNGAEIELNTSRSGGSTSATAPALSSLTAAMGTNTIDNTLYAQTWGWSTATSTTGLTLTANALTTGSMLALTSSGTGLNSTNGLLYVANTDGSTSGALASFVASSTLSTGLFVRNNGNVGIGTSTPDNRLSVQQAATGVVASFTNGTGTCTIDPTTTALICSSDETLKHDINALDAGVLEDLMLLKPSRFVWNNDTTGAIQYGFIAQEVARIFPTLVATSSIDGTLMLSQVGMMPFVVRSVQELAEIASGTAPLIDGEGNETFVGRFFDRMREWLADSANGIGQLFAKEANVETLCIGVAGDATCLNKVQIDALLQSIDTPSSNEAVLDSGNDSVGGTQAVSPDSEEETIEPEVVVLESEEELPLPEVEEPVSPEPVLEDVQIPDTEESIVEDVSEVTPPPVITAPEPVVQDVPIIH